MTLKKLLVRYAFDVALREWIRLPRVSAQTRVAVTAVVGALVAPVVVVVAPTARLYWLLTGKQLPRPLGVLMRQPHVIVNPFPADPPAEIRELLDRPEYSWEPRAGDVPWWYNARVQFGRALYWGVPCGLVPAANRDARLRSMHL